MATAGGERGNAASSFLPSQRRRRLALLRRRSEGVQRARRGAHPGGREDKRKQRRGRRTMSSLFACALALRAVEIGEEEVLFIFFISLLKNSLNSQLSSEESLSLFVFDATTHLSLPFLRLAHAAAHSNLCPRLSSRALAFAQHTAKRRKESPKRRKRRQKVFRWPKWQRDSTSPRSPYTRKTAVTP
jgi:hypothetical protein